MKSMTGYGYGEYRDESLSINLELKAYNNRYLDIIVNVPPSLNSIEPRLREFLSGKILRGRVELYIKCKELSERVTVTVDEELVKTYASALKELALAAGVNEDIRLSHLLEIDGVLKTEKKIDMEYYHRAILGTLEKAYMDFDRERRREGDATKKDILDNLVVMEEALNLIEENAPLLEEKIMDTIRERFFRLLGEEIDETRVLSETALMLVKYNINEEIVRIKGHLSEFRSSLEEDNQVGKKLDFLCQELNREINTIGSKSVMLKVNQAVIKIKDSLEKIREQLRNVE
ncbi:MAG: YicC family protein [Spirochaetes bacterium]|nr:MAG: YicC family protein [Spirochaetota bacterium]